MHKKNISRFKVLQAIGLLCLFGASSCASKNDVDGDAPSLPVSEASLLSDSEISESQADSQVFKDLDPAKAGSDAAMAMPVDASAGPFYRAIGGESLGRVAYTLYGDRSYRKQLKEKNSGLPKSIPAGQPVYFDFENVKPQAMFLTKDLLDRYPNELSDKLKSASATPAVAGTVTVQTGETLQGVSQRLYGTTRYWTELYLLNHEKIKNYDRVPAGLTLTMLEHGAAPAPVANNSMAPVAEEFKEPAQMEAPMNTQAAPVAQPTMDPLGETPEQEPVQAPSLVTPVPAARPAVSQEISESSFMDKIGDSGNSNLRRIIYVLLIVGIGGAAFYFTRPTRKSKIDMLDVTAGSTAPPPPRSRLGSKESTRKTVG